MILPRPSTTGERRAEIRGRSKSDSLLRDQEAVCLQVIAGARNHLQANRSLEFRFEIRSERRGEAVALLDLARGHYSNVRSSRRMILPVDVFGRSATKRTERGSL